MRDPRDPGGEYERDAGFGFVAPEGHAWTDKDYIDHVLGKHDGLHIGSKVRAAIAQRERLGFERYHRPLTKDTCDDNIQEAIEECGDLLFYLVAAHEKHKELCAEKERLEKDSLRLDWLEQKCSGASDSSRYLPFRIYWGGGSHGDIRRAVDEAMAATNER